ncbi:DUF3558 family protein [Streptomyces sp. NPDC006617]|uniref:DUF3558 family protein n=1 Tax=Streptomyces sp. NPDC006617 TaxID=3155354 RepID=UPI0033B8D63F
MSLSPGQRRFGPATLLLTALTLLVAGCSSSGTGAGTATGSPSTGPSPSAPSPSTTDLTQAMGRYAVSSCAMLSDEERAAYGIAQPGRMIDLSEGPAESCYWLVSTGVQIGWIPYPSDQARDKKAKLPGARQIEIAGYGAVQTADDKSCYQNVRIGTNPDFIVAGSSGSFSTTVIRNKPDAPKEMCEIATLFSELFISKLQQLDLSD